MSAAVEKLILKIAEGYQSASLKDTTDKVNIFHRKVTLHGSTDLSFLLGLTSTGLRGLASVTAAELMANFHIILEAERRHLPIVISVSGISSGIAAFAHTHIIQFVVADAQDHINYLLLAQKVAELSLVPVIVFQGYTDPATTSLPADDLIRQYLGDPDSLIDAPTPSQQIIFGAKRRRMPNWFNLDLPVMQGVVKSTRDVALEAMANDTFFAGHNQQLIDKAIDEFEELFGLELNTVAITGKPTNYQLIKYGEGKADFEQLAASKKKCFVTISQINPLPSHQINEVVAKAKAITVVESVGTGGSGSVFRRNIKELAGKVNFYAAQYEGKFEAWQIAKVFQHMIDGQLPENYYLGLHFSKEKSKYPKHEILLQEINKKYPGLTNQTVGSANTKTVPKAPRSPIPDYIRKHTDKGPAYSQLANYYDNTALFYELADHDELVAHPFKAIPVSPGTSAGFFSADRDSGLFPTFRPSICTGCGDCFVHCPHSAIPPVALGVEQLLRTGIDLASAQGQPITKLTPMLKNMAKLAGKAIGNQKIKSVTDFLPATFNTLADQMKLDGEKRIEAETEFNRVLNELAVIPAAVTEKLFYTPEKIEKGSGDIFSLAVNPTTCTACGICAEVCLEDAIIMADEFELDKAQQVYETWEQLPDTSSATVNRLLEDEDYDDFAAIMLSRKNYLTLSGAGTEEKDNAFKSLMHLVTATVESIVQPKFEALVANISNLIDAISENVHESLSTALPKENLDALAKTLRETRSEKASFQEIVDKINEFDQGKPIDTQTLRRKTDLVDALKNLKWVLTDGPTGVGRAGAGLFLSGKTSLGWASSYPANLFSCPVVVHESGSAPEQTLGLMQGQIRHQIDNIKLIRRAELEAVNKYDPAAHDLEIAALDWNRLTQDERGLIQPVLLVAERDDLLNAGWQSLSKLLAEEFPVKVVLLDHVAPPTLDPVPALIQTFSGLINAIALKKAFVFQGSRADMKHLAKGLRHGLTSVKPALLNLYAFKQALHQRSSLNDLPYAQLATNSRTFPAIHFDPESSHGFLNGAIELDANIDVKDDWVSTDVELPNGESLTYEITWADWAFTQTSWRQEFMKVANQDDNVLLAKYITMDTKERANKIPVIMRVSSKGITYYSVSRKVVQMTDTILNNWKTLQELAGLITEFPTKLSEEVRNELSEKFEEDLKAVEAEYEDKLREQEKVQIERIRQQIKEKLVALSKMTKN